MKFNKKNIALTLGMTTAILAGSLTMASSVYAQETPQEAPEVVLSAAELAASISRLEAAIPNIEARIATFREMLANTTDTAEATSIQNVINTLSSGIIRIREEIASRQAQQTALASNPSTAPAPVSDNDAQLIARLEGTIATLEGRLETLTERLTLAASNPNRQARIQGNIDRIQARLDRVQARLDALIA